MSDLAALRMLVRLNHLRAAGERAAADDMQAQLDELDRKRGYDRRQNRDVGVVLVTGQKHERSERRHFNR